MFKCINLIIIIFAACQGWVVRWRRARAKRRRRLRFPQRLGRGFGLEISETRSVKDEGISGRDGRLSARPWPNVYDLLRDCFRLSRVCSSHEQETPGQRRHVGEGKVRERSFNSKGEVSLYGWPPVWLVWIQLLRYRLTSLVKSKRVEQVSHTVILTLTKWVFSVKANLFTLPWPFLKFYLSTGLCLCSFWLLEMFDKTVKMVIWVPLRLCES